MIMHTYFKQNDIYKVRMFINLKSILNNLKKEIDNIINQYELENNCSLGETKELKILNIPKAYLEKRNIQVFEKELNDLNLINEIKMCKSIVEI